MAPYGNDKVTKEINRLLSVGFIKPINDPKLVSNVITIPKKNGKIRVCIDFTNLRKACPMHPTPTLH